MGSEWASDDAWANATYGSVEAYNSYEASQSSPGGGSISTSVLTATAPVGSQQWWSQAITEHSAGLESYTPSTGAGVPGVTQLTGAGMAALQITYTEPVYSWFDTTGTPVPAPLPAGAIMFLGVDFTPLANVIRTPILEAMTEIVNYLKGIVKSVTDTLSTVFEPAFLAIGGIITDILAGVNAVATDAGKYIVGIWDQVIKATAETVADIRTKIAGLANTIIAPITAALHDLEVWMQGIWAGVARDVSGILDAVQAFGPGLQKALDKLPDLAFTALLRALDRAVSK